jgi:hypothetical protein
MTDHRPGPDSEFAASRAAAAQRQPPGGCFCYPAMLDDLLSDDMMGPVLRSAGYEPDEFREMMTEMEMARRGETRCSCD